MDQNNLESVPNDFGNHSEDAPNASEEVRNSFGNDAETQQSVPKQQRTEHHSLTVRDVAHIFDEHKLSVTERTITNWCKPNAKGVCRLDCVYEESDYRYYITPQSVEKVMKEERSRFRKFTEFFWKPSEEHDEPSEDVPNDFGNKDAPLESIPKEPQKIFEPASRVSEVQRATHSQGDSDAESGNKLFELQAQVMELRIENKAKDFFIEQLKGDRETFRKGFEEERKQFIDLISKQAAQIGEYKEKLLQLEAPRAERPVRDATVESDTASFSQPDNDEPRPSEGFGSDHDRS